jgi:hypothetical protein
MRSADLVYGRQLSLDLENVKLAGDQKILKIFAAR